VNIVGIHLEPGGVGWLRCWNWTTALRRRGHKVKHQPHASKQFEWHQLDDYLGDADVVIAGRMAHAQLFAALLAGRSRYHYKLVVDTDDNSDDIPHFNYAHPDYHPGTNVSRLIRTELREADLVTVSTQPLAAWASQYAKRIVVAPNCVDTRLYDGVRSRQKEHRHRNDLRIYWGGGGGHYDDLLVARDAVLRIMRERPNAKLIFSNFIPDWAADLPPFRVFMIRFAHFNAYPKVLKWLCADVAIAPLVDNAFNTCKSNIKYLTYAMSDIPAVYQDLAPYSNVLHGVTGMKAATSDDWYEHLNTLLDYPELRATIAREAKRDVLANWTIDRHIVRYEAMLSELANQHIPELTYLTEGRPVEAPCLTSA
jgi:glycosyltransferase involved in cell wall biosynthesis